MRTIKTFIVEYSAVFKHLDSKLVKDCFMCTGITELKKVISMCLSCKNIYTIHSVELDGKKIISNFDKLLEMKVTDILTMFKFL